MTTKPKLPSGTVTKLSSVLSLSKRRCQELLAQGMPSDIEGAVAWRKAHSSTDSAERLRLERIELVREQKRRIAMENDARRGELIPAGQVQADFARVCGAARGELLKLASDLPGMLDGLPPSAMAKIIRENVHEILVRLSDPASYTVPVKPERK